MLAITFCSNIGNMINTNLDHDMIDKALQCSPCVVESYATRIHARDEFQTICNVTHSQYVLGAVSTMRIRRLNLINMCYCGNLKQCNRCQKINVVDLIDGFSTKVHGGNSVDGFYWMGCVTKVRRSHTSYHPFHILFVQSCFWCLAKIQQFNTSEIGVVIIIERLCIQ